MPVSQQSGQSDDRLHREVDEILEQARPRPVSFQQRAEQKRSSFRQRRQSTTPALRGLMVRGMHLLLKIPILTALALALVAAWLAPEFRVLATLFAFAAVIMVFVPFAVRRPASSLPEQTRWRGRVVSNLPPASDNRPRRWTEDIKRRFNR